MDSTREVIALTAVFIIRKLVVECYAYYKRRSKRKKHLENIGRSVENDALISNLLSQLLYATNSDKAKVFRAHNGGAFANGDSMPKFSLAYLQLRKGVAGPRTGILKDLLWTLFPNLRATITADNRVYTWKCSEAPDDYLKRLLRDEGVEWIKCVSLRNYKKEFLGFISINWIDVVAPLSEEHDKIISRFAEEISDRLSMG